MIGLPADILNTLEKCFIKRFSEDDLKMFCDENYEIIEIDLETEIAGTTHISRVKSFVKELQKRKTILPTIVFLCEHSKLKGFVEVKAIRDWMHLMFETNGLINDPPTFNLRQQNFQRLVLDEDEIFIDREHVITHLLNVLNTRRNRIILIDGPPRSGKSHLGFYLSDISLTIESFKAIRIHLNEINSNPTSQITARKIAESINEQFTIANWENISAQKELKIESFVGAFKDKIEESNKPIVLYIDQFTEGISEDVVSLITRLCFMTLSYTTNCVLILSGYKEELPRNYREKCSPIILNSFTENQVNSWLVRFYETTKDKSVRKETMNSFTTKIFETFNLDAMLNEKKNCNVSRVSKALNGLSKLI